MESYSVNAAIQLLPSGEKKRSWDIIDKAIHIIQTSGLKYKVCPFETVVEGDYSAIAELIKKIRDQSFSSGAEEILINVKFHFGAGKDILIQDKMDKYE